MREYMKLIEEMNKSAKDGYITLGNVIRNIYKIDVVSIEDLEKIIISYGLKNKYWDAIDLNKENLFTVEVKSKLNYKEIQVFIYHKETVNFTDNNLTDCIKKANEYFND